MPARQILFARFRFDTRTRELFEGGRRVRLAAKPARLLEALIARPGDLVTRDELRRTLWGADTFVDFDNNLNSTVAALRDALGDAAHAPRYIETLPRLGYRFIGTIDADRSVWGAARLRAIAALCVVAIAASAMQMRRITPAPEPPEVSDARYLLAQTGPGDWERARLVLEPLVTARSAHPAATEALAELWFVRALAGGARTEAFERAESAARRATAADASRAGAWRVLAGVRLHRDRDVSGAAPFASRAIAAAPRDPAAHLMSAAVDSVRGRHDAAIASATEAIRLDAASWRVRADLAFFLLAASRYEAALDASRSTLALEPASTAARDIQLTAAARMGLWAEAREAAVALMAAGGADPSDIDGVKRGAPRDGVARYHVWQTAIADRLAAAAGWPPMTAAAIYAAAGDAARAVQWLRRARETGDSMLVFLPVFRDFDPIRDDPAFRAFTASAG